MSRTGDEITWRTSQLRGAAGTISGLARAFARTGNATVSEELFDLSEQVEAAAEAIHAAYYEERNVNLRQSIANGERFMGAILQGVLNGQSPKDACLTGAAHHLDRDLIDAREANAEEAA